MALLHEAAGEPRRTITEILRHAKGPHFEGTCLSFLPSYTAKERFRRSIYDRKRGRDREIARAHEAS
jgi:hypothetical protein